MRLTIDLENQQAGHFRFAVLVKFIIRRLTYCNSADLMNEPNSIPATTVFDLVRHKSLLNTPIIDFGYLAYYRCKPLYTVFARQVLLSS